MTYISNMVRFVSCSQAQYDSLKDKKDTYLIRKEDINKDENNIEGEESNDNNSESDISEV